MYICPTCSAEFDTEERIVKHYLSCWKKKNPSHKSKSAPRSKDIENREINSDIEEFLLTLEES